MSPKKNPGIVLIASLAASSLIPHSAMACAACAGGNSSDAMALGMNMGILALLVVVGSVLIAFAAFAVFLARRAARFPVPSASGIEEEEAAAQTRPAVESQFAPSISQPTK